MGDEASSKSGAATKKMLDNLKERLRRVLYASVSLSENAGTIIALTYWTVLFALMFMDYLADHLQVTIQPEAAVILCFFLLLTILLVCREVRRTPDYVRFLGTYWMRQSQDSTSRSLKGDLRAFREHMKALHRTGNYTTMQHFDAFLKAAQFARRPSSVDALTFRQLAYGIELGMARESQKCERSHGRRPFKRYSLAYDAAFAERKTDAAEWVDFLINMFDKQSDEVKRLAQSHGEESFYSRFEQQSGFWNVVVAVFGPILLLVYSIFT